ncbi:MAG: hypothetical protein ABJI33_03180 [Balneola sp.]
MINVHLPHITCPHCSTPILITADVLFSGGQSVCNGCGSELKVAADDNNKESLELLKTFADKISRIKGE